jgi:hypothetical protein
VGYGEGATTNDDAPNHNRSCLFRCFDFNDCSRFIIA